MAETLHSQDAETGTTSRAQISVVAETLTPQEVGVVRPMPRRKPRHTAATAVTLPRARRVVFKAGVIRPISRLFVWLWGAIRFYCGNLIDVLLRRDTVQRRAVRLRQIFESMGASLTKLGQQLSLRADLLPYAYCAELGKMLDRVPPFPTSEAIASIERNLGRPLDEVFKTFDPDPIGAASLACVYQAILKSGERVAVKVRRPGIGPLIAADLRAFDWLLNFAEMLTLVQPGLTGRFRRDIRTILFNEMNFRTEARYIDLFRRRRSGKRGSGVTAPKVYFDYCTEEVLVSEFVSGVWMWELMAAVDAKDEEFLSQLREQGIEPKSLARKLINVMHREVLEELFFHADPHPANIVIRPNNGICYVDFGAIGRFSTETRKSWREMMYHMRHGDITRMVNCAITLAGPLPPIDVERVSKEFEEIYADWVYAQKSTDAEWWERSSAQAWLRYIEVARKFAFPVNLETIQFFRATFLYDSIINRLDHKIDLTREFESYIRQSAKEARRRVQKNMKKRLWGLTDRDYLNVEQIADSATQFVFNLQRKIEQPVVQYRNIVGKIAYTASLLLRLGYLAATGLGIALLVDSFSKQWLNYEIDWSRVLERMTTFGWVQVISLIVALVVVRRIVIRLNQPDFRPDQGT
jgi:predicted unusual protein kinase regulating ubiquinone biosynthesis (AarF/ABC1/UbiB family)